MVEHKIEHVSVLVPLVKRPICTLTEVDRSVTPGGFDLIHYRGLDGNTYHEFLDNGEVTWLLTVTLQIPATE